MNRDSTEASTPSAARTGPLGPHHAGTRPADVEAEAARPGVEGLPHSGLLHGFGPPGSGSPTWVSLQYLRAAAAMMVVVYHMHHQLQRLGYDGAWPEWTQRGVDVFFIISGVVMWLTTCGRATNPLAFYARRLVRIAPLYYLLTTLVVVALIVWPAAVQSGRFDGPHVLASYLFLPALHPVTAQPVPVLIPGWTLNCEVLFYAVFGLTLLLRESLRIPATSVVMVLICLVAATAPGSAPAQLYGSSIMLEFSLGLILGAALGRGWALATPYAWTALGLGGLALATLVPPEAPRLLAAGLPACAIVAGALSLERRGRMPKLPGLRLLGDASYALYLSHGIVLSACAQIALGAGGRHGAWTSVAFVPASACAVTLSAVALYRYVERPLLHRLSAAKPTAPR